MTDEARDPPAARARHRPRPVPVAARPGPRRPLPDRRHADESSSRVSCSPSAPSPRACSSPPAPASAHPLGNFTVNRYTGILVSPDGVEVDHVVDLAEIPTAQLGRRHRRPARPGASASAPPRVAASTSRSAGTAVPLTLESSSATTARRRGRTADHPHHLRLLRRGRHRRRRDHLPRTRTAPGSVGWREVTAVGDEMTLTSSDVPGDSTSDRLTSYPEDLLQSPLDVTSATLVVSPGGPAGVLPGSERRRPDRHRRQLALVPRHRAARRERLARRPVLAVLAALALGATHALSPGPRQDRDGVLPLPARRLLAALGARGRQCRHRGAHRVGAVLGLLVSLSSAFVPARHLPVADARHRAAHRRASGSTCWLDCARDTARARARPRARPRPRPRARARARARPTPPADEHAHPTSTTTHPSHAARHAHGRSVAAAVARPPAEPETAPGRWGVWVMGLVGGLVPSPSALLLLLAAVAAGAGVVRLRAGARLRHRDGGLPGRGGPAGPRLVLRLERLALQRGFLAGRCGPSCATAPRSASARSVPASSSAPLQSGADESAASHFLRRISNPVTGFAPN